VFWILSVVVLFFKGNTASEAIPYEILHSVHIGN
jgi:hypothetical protein